MIHLLSGDSRILKGAKSIEHAFWKPSRIAIIIILVHLLPASYFFNEFTCSSLNKEIVTSSLYTNKLVLSKLLKFC